MPNDRGSEPCISLSKNVSLPEPVVSLTWGQSLSRSSFLNFSFLWSRSLKVPDVFLLSLHHTTPPSTRKASLSLRATAQPGAPAAEASGSSLNVSHLILSQGGSRILLEKSFPAFDLSDGEKGESEPHGNVVRKGGMAQILISVSLVFKYFYSQVLHVSPKK